MSLSTDLERSNFITEDRLKAMLFELRELASKAHSEEEGRQIISRIAQISRAYRVQHGIGVARSPADQAMELDPRFRVRPHTRYISDVIAEAVRDVERGQSRRLIVSLPPRAGKSVLTSLHTPLWIFRRHPEWSIMMASYDPSLTTAWARQQRITIEDKPDMGIALKRDGGASGRWQTLEGGGMFATGVGGAMTGRGAKVMIIDDPIANFTDAHSLRIRDNLWNWWLSVAQTRLEPPSLVIVVMCMTGDTPVLMADGTERPLRDVRPGDQVATFEGGRPSVSQVKHWANQGPDYVYSVILESGRVLRANARHPFRVVDGEGRESWRRVSQLRPGDVLRTARGEGSPALTPSAASLSAAKVSVVGTMRRLVGQRAMVEPLLRSSGSLIGSTDMVLPTRSISSFWSSKTEDVQSVANCPLQRTPEGDSSCLSTMSTSRMSFESIAVERLEVETEGCSATTATSSSDMGLLSTDYLLRPSTFEPGLDVVASIVLTDYEDVFDIEVERTHNFIANGVQVSNTRWHTDDFVGRLLSSEWEGDPKEWTEVVLPALADREADPLGRSLGEPLYSPLASLDSETPSEAVQRWKQVKVDVGSYTFEAMYQQHPAPQAGAVFDAGWWRYWTNDPAKATEDGRIRYIDPDGLVGAQWLDSWDTAFKSGEDSSWVVGQRWAREGPNRYLITQKRGRWSFTRTLTEMEKWGLHDSHGESPYGRHVHKRLIEEKANGAAIIDVLKAKISGIKAINPRDSKEARARAITPEVESGHVYLPHPTDKGHEWVQEFLSELRNFPHGENDDQVDTLTQALEELRGPGRGGITVPGRRPAPGVAGRSIPQNRVTAAQSAVRQIPRR